MALNHRFSLALNHCSWLIDKEPWRLAASCFQASDQGNMTSVLTKPRSSAAGPSLSSDFASLWAARGREKQTLPPPHPVENQGFNLTLSRKIEAERTSSLDGGRGGEGRC